MTKYFKNTDKQALLEELVEVCESMVHEGLLREGQGVVVGTSSIYLSYHADKGNNRLDMDLIKSNR